MWQRALKRQFFLTWYYVPIAQHCFNKCTIVWGCSHRFWVSVLIYTHLATPLTPTWHCNIFGSLHPLVTCLLLFEQQSGGCLWTAFCQAVCLMSFLVNEKVNGALYLTQTRWLWVILHRSILHRCYALPHRKMDEGNFHGFGQQFITRKQTEGLKSPFIMRRYTKHTHRQDCHMYMHI